MKQRVLIVVGTRPEAIKMAPVMGRLRAEPGIEMIVVGTGQHQEMLQQALAIFDIAPDHDLKVMRPNQSPSTVSSLVIENLDSLLATLHPQWVIVHGDTTTAMAAGIAAFHRGIPVGHVEAGLRTGNLARPFPEEFNRRCVDLVAQMLWAPTGRARDNLLAESLPAGKQIFITGNTIIDALDWASARIQRERDLAQALDERLPKVASGKRMILVTGHRRESFGEGFENICRALQTIAARSDVEIVYPVHLNPNVVGPVRKFLGDRPNVHLVEPLDYMTFVRLMQRADFILTDSGGVQEEAPSLNKPVLVMREVTERPEAIAAGAAKLVGTRCDSIVGAATELLDNSDVRRQMAAAKNPYGDGRASERIVNSLLGLPVAEFNSI